MGLRIFSRSCATNYAPASTPTSAPNPDPKPWELLSAEQYANAYVLIVKYLDATNFEGVKVMVYGGRYKSDDPPKELDPHFTEDQGGPIARFRPDSEGRQMAAEFARTIGPMATAKRSRKREQEVSPSYPRGSCPQAVCQRCGRDDPGCGCSGSTIAPEPGITVIGLESGAAICKRLGHPDDCSCWLTQNYLVRFGRPIDEPGPMPWPLDISFDHGETWRPMTAEERAEYDVITGNMFAWRVAP